MAFKIKSAKIFFGIKEHTVMLLSVVLSYLGRTAPLQDINRKRKRGVLPVVMPTSCKVRWAPGEGHTGTESCPSWLREGEAAEFSHRKTRSCWWTTAVNSVGRKKTSV